MSIQLTQKIKKFEGIRCSLLGSEGFLGAVRELVQMADVSGANHLEINFSQANVTATFDGQVLLPGQGVSSPSWLPLQLYYFDDTPIIQGNGWRAVLDALSDNFIVTPDASRQNVAVTLRYRLTPTPFSDELGIPPMSAQLLGQIQQELVPALWRYALFWQNLESVLMRFGSLQYQVDRTSSPPEAISDDLWRSRHTYTMTTGQGTLRRLYIVYSRRLVANDTEEIVSLAFPEPGADLTGAARSASFYDRQGLVGLPSPAPVSFRAPFRKSPLETVPHLQVGVNSCYNSELLRELGSLWAAALAGERERPLDEWLSLWPASDGRDSSHPLSALYIEFMAAARTLPLWLDTAGTWHLLNAFELRRAPLSIADGTPFPLPVLDRRFSLLALPLVDEIPHWNAMDCLCHLAAPAADSSLAALRERIALVGLLEWTPEQLDALRALPIFPTQAGSTTWLVAEMSPQLAPLEFAEIAASLSSPALLNEDMRDVWSGSIGKRLLVLTIPTERFVQDIVAPALSTIPKALVPKLVDALPLLLDMPEPPPMLGSLMQVYPLLLCSDFNYRRAPDAFLVPELLRPVFGLLPYAVLELPDLRRGLERLVEATSEADTPVLRLTPTAEEIMAAVQEAVAEHAADRLALIFGWLESQWDRYDHPTDHDALMLLRMTTWLAAKGRPETLYMPCELWHTHPHEANELILAWGNSIHYGSFHEFLGLKRYLPTQSSSEGTEKPDVEVTQSLAHNIRELLPRLATLEDLLRVDA